MTWFIPTFVAAMLTARFFSETLGIVPKAVDLVDIAVIPLLSAAAVFTANTSGSDPVVQRRMFRSVAAFVVLAVVSAVLNASRTSWPPVTLFIFGMLEGPLLFLALNRLVRRKHELANRLRRLILPLFVIEAVVVVFVNLPMFLSSGNPDVMSGTFGLNSYQFSFLLVIFGGYFVGRMRIDRKSYTVGAAALGGIFVTFLLLQYRTGAPAFFLSFAVLLGVLFGKRVMRLVVTGAIVAGLAIYSFQLIMSSRFELKFEDFGDLASNPAMVAEFGKVIAHRNVLLMYGDMPHTVVIGAGPGTMVSRAAATFIIEPLSEKSKGVGSVVTAVFGPESFHTDVFGEYVAPVFGMESFFGSDQANSPSSSVLAAAAETGILGLFIILSLYVTLLTRALKMAGRAAKTDDVELTPISAALAAGALYLCLLAPIDNYFEIARVTIPIWALFWAVNVLHRDRRRERVEREYARLHAARVVEEVIRPEGHA